MVGIVVTGHGRVASSFVQAAVNIMGKLEGVVAVDILESYPAKEMKRKMKEALEELKDVDGVLILAELFGSSSCNVALNLACKTKIRVLTGLNMPMLLKAITYKDILPLEKLAEVVLEAGRQGILDATAKCLVISKQSEKGSEDEGQ